MQIPRREETKRKYYHGEFPNLDLTDSKFPFPEELVRVYEARNPNMPVKFYAYKINDDGLTYVSLFDPLLVESDKSGRLRKDQAQIITLDVNLLTYIPFIFIECLRLTNKVSVDGHDKVVRLWNPKELAFYSPREGVDFDGDLSKFQRDSYKYLKSL